MSLIVKYKSYPETIDEVRMELGSPERYQTIQAVEKKTSILEEQEKQEYEIEFRVVDNGTSSVIKHIMSREDLNNYISVLKHILAQTK